MRRMLLALALLVPGVATAREQGVDALQPS